VGEGPRRPPGYLELAVKVPEIPLEVFRHCLGCPHLTFYFRGFHCNVPIRHCHRRIPRAWRKKLEKGEIDGKKRADH